MLITFSKISNGLKNVSGFWQVSRFSSLASVVLLRNLSVERVSAIGSKVLQGTNLVWYILTGSMILK